MYSLPSSARARNTSRVSLPERGAYRTPTTAPKPNPAKNHPKLLPSRSDITIPPGYKVLIRMVAPVLAKYNYGRIGRDDGGKLHVGTESGHPMDGRADVGRQAR